MYDQSVKLAMHKQLHATMSEAEISNLGKQCVRVQAVFRGLRARQKVSLLRDGIDSEAPKGLSETSFKSLTGAGNELRQLKKGAWALFRFIATLAFGGNRFLPESKDYMNNKDETALAVPIFHKIKRRQHLLLIVLYSDNLQSLCFHANRGTGKWHGSYTW